jgi:hypothetical protein
MFVHDDKRYGIENSRYFGEISGLHCRVALKETCRKLGGRVGERRCRQGY